MRPSSPGRVAVLRFELPRPTSKILRGVHCRIGDLPCRRRTGWLLPRQRAVGGGARGAKSSRARQSRARGEVPGHVLNHLHCGRFVRATTARCHRRNAATFSRESLEVREAGDPNEERHQHENHDERRVHVRRALLRGPAQRFIKKRKDEAVSHTSSPPCFRRAPWTTAPPISGEKTTSVLSDEKRVPPPSKS